MTEHDSSSHHTNPARSFWKTRSGIGLIVFLAIAGLLLAYEHRIHVFGGNGLLITFLAVCIGMHFFMHGGHGGHGSHDEDNDDFKGDNRP